MSRLDLSSYLARETCKHVQRNVGQGQRFGGGLFLYDPGFPNQVPVYGDRDIFFHDRGSVIAVRLDSNAGSFDKEIYEEIRKRAHVPGRYEDVASGVSVHSENGGVEVRVAFKHLSTSSGRTGNSKRIFYAVFSSGVRPILEALTSNSG